MVNMNINLERMLSYLVKSELIPSDVLPKTDVYFDDKISIKSIKKTS
jgi:hypothetical protein